MPTSVAWILAARASGLWAVDRILADVPLADERLDALVEPARLLSQTLADRGISAGSFLCHAIPLSSDATSERELATTALVRLVGRQQAQESSTAVAAAIAAIHRAFEVAVPEALVELELRGGPLFELWEARGQGLLSELARITSPELLPESAQVLVVLPAVGGGGAAFLQFNRALIEGVLANPQAELPEVLRLGWLLSTLNLDLPRYSESIARPRLAEIAPLAMLPPALAAARVVELVADPEALIRPALEAWCPQARQRSAEVATCLSDWWDTCQESSTPWHVALPALDQMLGTI